MIAHDICYPSHDTFCQKRIISELDTRCIFNYCMVSSDHKVIAEFWVFDDDSVAISYPNNFIESIDISCPDRIIKAYPSIKFIVSHN